MISCLLNCSLSHSPEAVVECGGRYEPAPRGPPCCPRHRRLGRGFVPLVMIKSGTGLDLLPPVWPGELSGFGDLRSSDELTQHGYSLYSLMEVQ